MNTPNSRSLQMILAGESGMLCCKSSHIGGGIDGSLTYQVVGFEGNNKVAFKWNVPFVGQNKYDSACATDAFKVTVLGGHGNQAVVIFVFGKWTTYGNNLYFEI
jgi:hypothetical protein